MPAGFSEHEKELISQRLLEQGYRLFSIYGIKKTSIEDITRAAGISRAVFYNFYDSKEALFWEVMEQTEIRIRQDLLAAVAKPGPSPRARLFAILQNAFSLLKTIPFLQIFSGSDLELLFLKRPPEKLQQHLSSDQNFLVELISACQQAGIPICVPPEQIMEVLYPLVLAALQNNTFGPQNFGGSLDQLLELAAAFCLGEVELQLQNPGASAPASNEGS
jgi:AcrR family transcriptional regulator